jgi:hypothetical protein
MEDTSQGDYMKRTWMLLSAVVLFAAVVVCYAADNLEMGTWKLNEAKSKMTGTTKNTTVIYEAVGDSVKVTVNGVDAYGKSMHNEWIGKYDGKDYPVTGDPTSDMRAYTKVNDHILEMTVKKDGKVTLTGSVVLAADGKSRTVSIKGTDAAGHKIDSVLVYDKQ